MLAKKWGTEIFPIPPDMEAPFMRLVRLPELKRYPVVKEVPGKIEVSLFLIFLFEENCEVWVFSNRTYDYPAQ